MLVHLLGSVPIQLRLVLATLTALAGALMLGRILIPWLRARHLLEPVEKTDSPELSRQHSVKKGTPTMGGIILISAIALSTLLWARLDVPYTVLVLFSLIGFGIIGLRDDLTKLRSRRLHGLTKSSKMKRQLLVSLVIALAVWGIARTGSAGGLSIGIPFFQAKAVHLAWLGGIPFILMLLFVLTGTANAVNLADGLDGLAAGCVMIASIAFGVVSLLAGHEALSRHLTLTYVPGGEELAVASFAMTGACLGFLWFNCYPAKVFMGDTGSLALGGALGTVAVSIRQEILLTVVGGIFVIEAMSVILQVFSFRVFGKRIFRIAPIHHHFQFGGWPETTITMRFWIVSALLAIVSVASLAIQ